MSKKTTKIKVKPIGYVKTKATEEEIKGRNGISQIIITKDLSESLEGLTDFSHLFILFWMHQISLQNQIKMKVHPRGREEAPIVGLFSTRTPYRPNPIGLCLVQLLKVQGQVLTVRGLDAYDGTPVLDIKPYDYWDRAEKIRIPKWWKKL